MLTNHRPLWRSSKAEFQGTAREPWLRTVVISLGIAAVTMTLLLWTPLQGL